MPNWTKERKRDKFRSNATSQDDNILFKEGVDGNNKFHVIKDKVSQGGQENCDGNPSHNHRRMLSQRSLILFVVCIVLMIPSRYILLLNKLNVLYYVKIQKDKLQKCKQKAVSHVSSCNEIRV